MGALLSRSWWGRPEGRKLEDIADVDSGDAAKHTADDIEKMEEEIRELQDQKSKDKDRKDWRRSQDLHNHIEQLKRKISVARFKRHNRTAYKASAEQAILSVTSDLSLPRQPLSSLSAAKMIAAKAKGTLIDEGGVSIELSDGVQRLLVDGHEHGFIKAVTSAFKDHYPLALRPQHFWLLVAQAVATHVDLHAEKVRSKWVPHDGKKTLHVICDDFTMGSANDWASVVSGRADSFSAQIAASTVPGVADVLSPPFGTTTQTEDIAQKIVVMDICKNYFDYKCSTCCGFPQITLEGSESDWKMLYEASEQLLSRCTAEFCAEWKTSLLPLLAKLAAARSGEVDAIFWNSMCKRGGTSGSGAMTWFNGWINVFFPYIDRRQNRHCVPYRPDIGYVTEGLVWDKTYGMCDNYDRTLQGPDCADFPNGLSCAPVTWEYYGHEVPLDFNAGFVGAIQDHTTLEIKPSIGWFITRRNSK